MEVANGILSIISSHGRRFFYHSGCVSHFDMDVPSGRLWFIDGYSQKRIYTAYRRGRWRGFSEGGTLRSLVENLSDYIVKGTPILMGRFGPWPKYLCDGDLWGYGDSMQAVRQEIENLIKERTTLVEG
jgi:hypothetical protein